MLKSGDVEFLIRLVSEEIERQGIKKELGMSADIHYFYKLVDIRNRLIAMPQPEEDEAAWNQFLKAFNAK